MMNSTWRALMVAVILFGTPAFPEGERTCALIADSALGFSESTAFELAQVELSKDSSLVLLERAEIDKVLEEQTLQMAFAPEGGADRRRLGSLLKADILVILHARGTDEVRSLEIVIAETKLTPKIGHAPPAVPAARGSFVTWTWCEKSRGLGSVILMKIVLDIFLDFNKNLPLLPFFCRSRFLGRSRTDERLRVGIGPWPDVVGVGAH